MNNEEEALGLLNRLLERLHQADLTNFGSHLQIVYVASGAQHVETQINIEKEPHPQTPLRRARGVESSATASQPAHHKDGELEGRIRYCIALLMEEMYGDEPLFNLQGHWQAVYRILVDKGYCRDSDFDGFDAFIRTVMPEKVNKPYKKDSVRNINKTDYNKPFDRWQYDPSISGTRKPFERMQVVAQRFKEILEENAANSF